MLYSLILALVLMNTSIKAAPITHKNYHERGFPNLMDFPSLSIPRPGFITPNPPYDLTGLSSDRKPGEEFRKEFEDMMKAQSEFLEGRGIKPKYFLIHGLSVDSSKRVLEFYYGKEKVKSLTNDELFDLAISVIFDLRNVLSCSVINPADPHSWYPGGVIIEMSPDALYAAGEVDKRTPMEKGEWKEGQEDFRKFFLHDNPLSDEQYTALEEEILELEKNPRVRHIFSKIQKLAKERNMITYAYGPPYNPEETCHDPNGKSCLDFIAKGHANEVAGLVKTEHPKSRLKIVGFWINSRNGKYGYVGTKDEEQSKKFTQHFNEKIRMWAKRTGLPCVEF